MYSLRSPRFICLLSIMLIVYGGSAGGLGAADEQPDNRIDGVQADVNSSTGVKVFDALIVRPAMLGLTAISSITFLATLPFAATGVAGLSVDKTRENLVSYPFNYTFKRPLGDFSESQ